MKRRSVELPQGLKPTERISAVAHHRLSVVLFVAYRLVGPTGREVATCTVSTLSYAGGRPRWRLIAGAVNQRSALASARADAAPSSQTSVIVDPTLAWHCDEEACRVMCPGLGLSAASAPWVRTRSLPVPRIPVSNGGLGAPRRVALSVDLPGSFTFSGPDGDVADSDVANTHEPQLSAMACLEGTHPGMLVAWPLPSLNAEARYHPLEGVRTVPWAEPAMRSSQKAS